MIEQKHLRFAITTACLIMWGCGSSKKAPVPTPQPACFMGSSDPGCSPSLPPTTPYPTPGLIASGCYVITSPNPSRAGELVMVNVFDTNYQGLALLGFGTSVEANAVFGTLYRNTTGTLTYPHPGQFTVQATAADRNGQQMSCTGIQIVQ